MEVQSQVRGEVPVGWIIDNYHYHLKILDVGKYTFRSKKITPFFNNFRYFPLPYITYMYPPLLHYILAFYGEKESLTTHIYIIHHQKSIYFIFLFFFKMNIILFSSFLFYLIYLTGCSSVSRKWLPFPQITASFSRIHQ